jgi:uncharacterized protein YndB with AHSA1/START domain
MNGDSMSIPTQSEAFSLTHKFPAARDLVFRAFTRAAHLRKWWGPAGFTVAVRRFDHRPGGVFHYSMQAPVGHRMGDQPLWGKFVYQEIALPERIALLTAFSDEGGGLTRHPARPTWPMQVCSDFTFTEQDGQTTVTLCATPHEATELERNTFTASRALVQKDVKESFAQLERYLAKLDGNCALNRGDSPAETAFPSSLAPHEQIHFV